MNKALVVFLLTIILFGGAGGIAWVLLKKKAAVGGYDGPPTPGPPTPGPPTPEPPTPEPPTPGPPTPGPPTPGPPTDNKIDERTPTVDSTGKLINLIVGPYKSDPIFEGEYDIGAPGLLVKEGDILNFTTTDYKFDPSSREYTVDLSTFKKKPEHLKYFKNFTASVTPTTIKISSIDRDSVYTFTAPPSTFLSLVGVK